jgi:glycerophosphoryl diester phosphodiesterase
MRNGLRALIAVIAAGVGLLLLAPTAHAGSLDSLVVAHRGATTSTVAEGTMRSYEYAVRQNADWLDGDVRWTKDSSDADTVGTMIISHDATLDRITNCSGSVSKKLWSYIRDRCRTSARTGSQRLLKLSELLAYGRSVGKPVALQIKLNELTNAQARQFWRAVKASKVRVMLEASSGQLPGMNKIKSLDRADTTYRITYAFVTSGSRGWPSVTTIRRVGTVVHARLEISRSVVRTYQRAGLTVYLYTGKNERDYARMAYLGPYGVVVDDVGRFQRWRNAQT